MDIVDLTNCGYNQGHFNLLKRLLADKQGFERVLDNLHELKLMKHNNSYFVVTRNKQNFIEIVCIIPTVEIKSTTFGEFISKNFNGAGVEIGFEPRNNTLYKIKVHSNEKTIDVNYHTNKFIEILDILTNKKTSTKTNTNTNAINIVKNKIQTYERKLQAMGTINNQLVDYKVLKGKVEVLRELLIDLSK